MSSSAPPPGRPRSAARRGMGGLPGALAVLAFLILAVFAIACRQPGRIADAPPPSPSIPAGQGHPSAPSAAPVAGPSDPPPTSDGTNAPPVPSAAPSPQDRKPAPPRRVGARPGINPPAGSAPRRFLLGATSVESLVPVGDLAGFEGGGVSVKRAPEVNGRLDLEMDPPQVRPGARYKVRLYLANDGDKDIPVQEIRVSTVENGRSSMRTMPSRSRSVKPRQRALLDEVEGVWRESARSWAMDVVVTSSRKDVYRNGLRWE